MRFLPLLVVLLPTLLLADEPLSPPVALLVEKFRHAQQLEIEHLEGLIARSADDEKAIRRQRDPTLRSRLEAHAENVRSLRDRLANAKAGKFNPQILLAVPYQVGDVGQVPGITGRVVQILGPKEMLVSMLGIYRDGGTLVRTHYTLLVKHDTQGLADNSDFDFVGYWHVSGTTSYESINGAKRTVQVFEPVDLESAANANR